MPSETTAPAAPTRLDTTPDGVAERLDDGDRCLGLLRAAAGPDLAGLALGVARALGTARPRTLLVNLEPDGPMDRILGVEGAPGLSAALRNAARMTEVAVRPDGQPYVYFPAGAEAAPPGAVLSSRAMGHFLRRAREGRATVLLYLPAGLSGAGHLLEPRGAEMDGVLLLGSASERAAPATLPLLGRVRRPGADGSDRRARSGASRRRVRSTPPGPPAGSGQVSLVPGDSLAAGRTVRWRPVLVLGGLALALGLLITWEGVLEALREWLSWSAELRGRTR